MEVITTSQVDDYQQSNNKSKDEGSGNCLTSLQALTSSISLLSKPPPNDAKKDVKPQAKRGRKKKLPVKFSQQPILPKVFAIQISPQTNVIAPVTTIMKTNTFQSTAKQVVTPVGFQLAGASTVQMSKTVSLHRATGPMLQQNGGEKMQADGSNFVRSHGANNAQLIKSAGLVVRNGRLHRGNRKRLDHNAAEKKRKERINGWISKIASVLFKYYPEKQHKIYILEKAYDFIAGRTQGNQEDKERQDACTQSDSREENTTQDLVCQIADLENLVDVLLKVIRRYKIPAPSSLFKSQYVKAKFGYPSPSAVSMTQLDENERIVDENSGTTDNRHQIAPSSAGDVTLPSSEVLVELSTHQRESNCNATLSLQPHAQNEGHETLTAVNVAPAGSLQESLSVAEAFIDVSKDAGTDSRADASTSVGRELCTGQSITVGQNCQIAMIGQSRLILPPDLPLLTAGSVMRNENSARNTSQPGIGTANILSHQTAQSNNGKGPYTGTDNSVVLENTTGVNNSGKPSKTIPERMLSISLNPEHKHGSNEDAISKAPSMESQMFVIKNLVQPRTKTILNGHALPLIATPAVVENNGDLATSSVARSNIFTPRTQADASGGSVERMIQSAPILSTSISNSFVRMEGSATSQSQQLHLVRQNQPNVATKNLSPQIVSAIGSVVVTQTGARPLRSQNIHCVSEVDKNISLPISCNQGFPVCQVGISGTQTCHTVTSLLGNVVTSPTESSALSIEAILADRPTQQNERRNAQRKSEAPRTKSNARAKQVERSGQHTQLSAVSKAESISRKRFSSSKSQAKPTSPPDQATIPPVSNASLHNTFSLAKPPAKRLKKSTHQHQPIGDANSDADGGAAGQSSARIVSNMAPLSMMRVEEQSQKGRQAVKRKENASQLALQAKDGLPKAHNFVSLAKKDQRGENHVSTNSSLGHFSAESLLRSNNPSTSQLFTGDSEQDGNLPTILNIFAPASVGSMVTQLPLSNATNTQHVTNNSNFPTIQSTFSNFSAEALIGGTIENQSTMNSAASHPNDTSLVQPEQQNLFTDFSTDALLAGTESSLSYGIDNIMSRNDVVASSSCISPSWLQTGAFIDNSPIRGNFNPGFSFLDTPNGLQGYLASGQAANFSTPIKWRQDAQRNDDQVYNNMPSSLPVGSTWSQNLMITPQKPTRSSQAKDSQRSKVAKSQSSNKRGPSFGDFLLVDSVSLS